MKNIKNNQCAGVYGKCLNIKVTNYCPGSCYFCIEKNGYSPKSVHVDELIAKANELEEYQTVLILGGEPFCYPHLLELVKGLKKKEIYITTNGGSFRLVDIIELSKYITGINISIHSFLEEENDNILHTKVSFEELKKYINLFQENNVPVRFNTILLENGINSFEKMKMMVDFAKRMNISWIRFSELQFEKNGFVFARDIFDGLNEDPFNEGCNQNYKYDDINITVRQSCGIVNLMKAFPNNAYKRENKAGSLIMYPNGEILNGWIVPNDYRINETEPCERVIEDSSKSK